jgi:hypothetical protein
MRRREETMRWLPFREHDSHRVRQSADLTPWPALLRPGAPEWEIFLLSEDYMLANL